jgi:lipoprotein-anchoring transpeptidase ErfK/SrfK
MNPASNKAARRETATWTPWAMAIVVIAMASSSAALQTVAPAISATNSEILQVAVRRVVISLPDRKLALIKNGQLVKIYRVAVGKPSTPSPTGEFKIVNRVTNPTYYHKGQVIPAGKSNPVGTRWMGLSAKSYGIHGTNQPSSIGKAASTGCIRMSQRDLEELFTLVEVGDAVEIRADRDDRVAAIFGQNAEATAQAQVESGAAGGQ